MSEELDILAFSQVLSYCSLNKGFWI